MSVAGHLAGLSGLVSLGQVALDGTEIKARCQQAQAEALGFCKAG